METKPAKFTELFRAGTIGRMEIRNRIVKSSTGTNFGDREGYVTEPMKRFYEETSKGGAGLIIVEIACVDSRVGKVLSGELGIDDDKYMPGLTQLAQCIKGQGARAAIQLHHAGREGKSKIGGCQPVAPSAIKTEYGEMPRELTVGEIKTIIEKFAEAAKRAKACGFDGVEFHSGHSYLIAQFLSSYSNKRRDEYGGPLENRARFLIEILRAVRESVGKDFPVWGRINGSEYGAPGGFTLSEAKEIAIECQVNGMDAVDVSAYGHGLELLRNIPSSEGPLVGLARAVKEAVKIPVMTVGKIRPELGEKVLREKSADFIAMGRALIADPALPNKLKSGRVRDIRPCIGCLQCLNYILIRDIPMRCSVNAQVGASEKYEVEPAKKNRKVCVIGGGPGGMEAARVARLRGHEVTLYEKDKELGGQLLAACKPPDKERIRPLIDYLKSQMKKSGVKVELQKKMTVEIMEDMKPEVVIQATGAKPIIPQIPGLNTHKLMTAEDVLLGDKEIGNKVAIIGGGMVGCEIAKLLSNKGKEVTIIEIIKTLASNEVPFLRVGLLEYLKEKKVRFMLESRCEKITKNGLVVVNKAGNTLEIEAETIVISIGSEANNGQLKTLKGRNLTLHKIGDCIQPRGILEAIEEGYKAALKA